MQITTRSRDLIYDHDTPLTCADAWNTDHGTPLRGLCVPRETSRADNACADLAARAGRTCSVKFLLFCRAATALSVSLHRCYTFQSPQSQGAPVTTPPSSCGAQRPPGSRGPISSRGESGSRGRGTWPGSP